MKKLITPDHMREREARWFEESGVRSIDIMENAATALAKVIRAQMPTGSKLYFACGTGGNGGDGTACARLLRGDYDCAIVQLKAPKTQDATENLERAQSMGIPVLAPSEASKLPVPDAWIDALFGTGFSGEPRGEAAELIEQMNRCEKVFSADIPSGLNGLTGEASAVCVHATTTVTFGWRKPGQVLADGLDCCRELICADVGFPEAAFAPFDAILIEREDLKKCLPKRPRNTYKNACGHLLIVAGSFGMAGAACMCAMAALRCGVGLVTLACPREIIPILQTRVPQAMCVPLTEEGLLPEGTLRGKTAIAVGCGLGAKASGELLRLILNCGLPAVVDADALNAIAREDTLKTLLQRHHVLTPHPGEARRLLGSVTTPMETAQALHALGATALYKGASCVICGDEDLYISASGCSGMARGGSGDILTGILGALLADPHAPTPPLTAALASELHGIAGQIACERYGERGMNALDLVECLPEALR